MARQSSRPADLDTQLKDIRRQLSDQLGSLDFRMESKLSLLAEFQEFFKKRGEVEYEYARSLERLCEKFERSTKQRNIKNEVRSTFNLWSTVLAETRKLSRERASFGETLASEMVARLDIMAKDVNILTKKCREICVEVQDHFLKELRDLGEVCLPCAGLMLAVGVASLAANQGLPSLLLQCTRGPCEAGKKQG
jgi:SLIT-ROBO Rho GTPase activating protein